MRGNETVCKNMDKDDRRNRKESLGKLMCDSISQRLLKNVNEFSPLLSVKLEQPCNAILGLSNVRTKTLLNVI